MIKYHTNLPRKAAEWIEYGEYDNLRPRRKQQNAVRRQVSVLLIFVLFVENEIEEQAKCKCDNHKKTQRSICWVSWKRGVRSRLSAGL